MNATPADPLWMPKGSIHALLTIGITGLSGYMVSQGIEVPEWWQVATFGALGGYSIYRHIAPQNQLSSRTYESQVNLDEVDLMKRGNQ